MKNFYPFAWLIFFSLCAGQLLGQTTSTSATYTTGVGQTDGTILPSVSATTINSLCPLTLTVNVPAGRYVTSVDVEYQMEALSFAWQSEQRSYLECVTKSAKEPTLSTGPGVNTSGIVNYSRTGLQIANGVVPTGGLQFKLHGFRTFGGSGCNTSFQRINNSTYKVTVHHIPAPTCLPPSGVQVTSITANTAQVSWTTGGAANWQLEYGPSGFTSGTMVNAGTNPFTLTGLNPSTSYEVRVRDSCGLGDVSFWTNVAGFKTACSVISAPWTENFSGPDWAAGSAFGSLGTIDTCFSRNYTNNFTFKTGPPSFSSGFSGPSGDHTTGSGKYAFSERIFFSSTTPNTAELYSPDIDLASLNIPELTFWYHMFGTDVHKLEVFISDDGGASYTSVFSKTGQQQSAKTDAWKEAVINLSSYANDTIRLKFLVTQNTTGFNGDVAIDDISIHEQPTCPKPTNLKILAATSTSVKLGWTSGGAANWQIEYGSPGFTVGSGTLVNVSSNPFTLTGLNPNTGYDFYVRDSCSATDKSAWSYKASGKTRCAPLTAPYSENFDGSSWSRGSTTVDPGTVNSCWSRPVTTNYFFKSGPPQFVSTFTGASADHTTGTSSGKYLQAERGSFTGGTDTAVIISPLIDLSGLTIPEGTFWYHMYGADIDYLEVSVSNDFGETYSQVHTLTGQSQTSNTAPWKELVLNLAAYANDTILLRFEAAHQNFGTTADLGIDDVDIHEQPSCPKPSNLSAFAWIDRVNLSWTSGGATNWQIEYGSLGFSLGSGTRISVGSNPYTLTGLSPNSFYSIYVRDSCGPGDVSAWVGPITIKTLCSAVSAPYSQPFTSSSFSAGPNFNSPGTIDACWRRNLVDFYVWKGGPPSFSSFNTGPDKDHTTGTTSGKYVYTASIGFTPSVPITSILKTVPVSLSSLTNPELSFWYHMFGFNIDTLKLMISDKTGNWNTIWTKVGQQQNAKSAAWKEAVINLAAYSGDTVVIQFVAVRNTTGTQAEIALDDIDFHEQPTCPKPQDLALVGQTNSTVTLEWISGGASDWNIEYGAVGFSPGSGTLVNAASNPFTVTGLSPNTTYQFYVRDSCAVGDVSVWVGPVQALTDCNPISAPYSENFDGSAFTIGTFAAPGNLASCWRRDSTVDFQWTPETSTSTFGSGPSADHTTGSGKFLFPDRFFSTSFIDSRVAEVITPLIDVTPLTTPELSFWYHMFGVDIDSLTVAVYDGASWTRVFSLAGQQQTSKTDAWKESIVNLSAFANDTIKIRFRGYGSTVFSFQSEMAIDDIDLHEQPTCPKPSNLAVTSTGATSVTLSWTSGGATDWQIEYGSPGFSPGSGTVVTASSNPFTVNGLASSTSYDFYVRDSCGATDLSAWFGPVGASTDCLPVSAPFSENFDGTPPWVVGPNFNDTGEVSQCWPRTPLVDYFWKPGPPLFTSTFTGPSADHTTGSGKFLFAESIFGGGTPPFDAYIESPEIDLSALTTPELSFWYHMFGTGIGTLAVEISNGGAYTQIWSKTGQQQNASSDAWKEAVLSLSAYAGDTVRIRFKGTKSSFTTLADAAIDDVDIHEAPSCPKPQDLEVVGTTNTSVTLQWTSGGAADWNIEYGAPGFSPGGGTLVNASSNPFTLTGLSPNTSYEFYVRDSCGSGDVSAWIGPEEATTDCNPVPAPYSENFDGSAWTIGTFTAPGNLASCWRRVEGVNYQWTPQTTTTLFASGPQSDHTTGSGKFLYTERFFTAGLAQTTEATLSTPLIDLSALTIPELSFWYHMFGADIDSLVVEAFDGAGWTSVSKITGSQQTSKTDLWKEEIVNLSAFANDTIKLRFRGYRTTATAFNVAMAIDDLDIHEQPSCPKPSGVSITSATTTSLTVSWTSGGASNWLIGYRPSGSSAPLVYIPVNANPYTINGLNPASSYDIYIKDSCGAGDVSAWTDVVIGNTLCGVVTAPWSESFDGPGWTTGLGFFNTGNTISSCWSRPAIDNFGTRTGGTNTFLSGPSADYSGSGKYLYIEADDASVTGEITTPSIYIPSGLVNPRLKFAYHMFGSNITWMGVKVDDGSGFGANIITKSGQQQTSSTAAWKVDSVSLNAYKGDTIEIKFLGLFSGSNGDMAIDEIQIVSDGGCADPSGINFGAITANSATVTWNSAGSYSEVEVVPLGQAQGTGTLHQGVTSPFGITGLNAGSTYIIYIRDSCSTSLSGWSHDTLQTNPCPVVNAGFTFTGNYLTADFDGSSTSGADSLYWTFGDGGNASGSNPSHVYTTSGTYAVTVFGYNDCGNSASFMDSITVCDTLKAEFTYSQNGDTLYFDGSASNGASWWEWDFGNGDQATGVNVQESFASTGNQTITLKVANDCGDTAITIKTISVCVPPVASWTYTILGTTGSGMKVQFDGTASQNAVTYHWNFGDGNTTSGTATPIHIYVTPGLFYKVTLTVTNSCGDSHFKAFKLNEVDLEEWLAEGVKLYPNPATGSVRFEWPAGEFDIKGIMIYDLSGREMLTTRPAEDRQGIFDLDISGLAPGYYQVKITGNQGSVLRKLIVK